MYTQSELRDALDHSASRADDLLDNIIPISPAHAGSGPGRRRTVAALAVAATVAAAAVGVTVWANSGSDGPDQQKQQAASSSHATTPAPVKPADAHAPVDLSALVDTLSASPDPTMYSQYELAYQPGVEEFSQWTGDGRYDPTLTVDVATPASGLNPDRIPRTHPIKIAGTTGYYSKFKLFPVDGSNGPGADKWLPRLVVAFPQGKNWVFVSLETGNEPTDGTQSLDDRDRIVQTYEKYHVTLGKSVARLPFRAGWLPDGLDLRSASFQTVPKSGAVAASGAGVTLTDGREHYLSIDLQKDTPGFGPLCELPAKGGHLTVKDGAVAGTGDCVEPPSRKIDGYTLTVTGDDGFDHATQQRVLDGIQLAKDLNNPSTFWSVQDALG